MKCDRCGEQLPVADGIDYYGQTLCLDCAMRGCNPDLMPHNTFSQDEIMRNEGDYGLGRNRVTQKPVARWSLVTEFFVSEKTKRNLATKLEV